MQAGEKCVHTEEGEEHKTYRNDGIPGYALALSGFPQAGLPEVPPAPGGVLEGEAVVEGSPLPGVAVRRKGALLQAEEILHVVVGHRGAVVDVAQEILAAHEPHQVGGVRRVQAEHPPLFVIGNGHCSSSMCF